MQKWRIVLSAAANGGGIMLDVEGFAKIVDDGTLIISRNGQLSSMTHAFSPHSYDYVMLIEKEVESR